MSLNYQGTHTHTELVQCRQCGSPENRLAETSTEYHMPNHHVTQAFYAYMLSL